MSLEAGTKLGPYEISAPVGAGGMGEVYRAKDTRLGRDVAVKVLPAHLSASAELRQRLEREAKTISSALAPSHLHAPRRRPSERDRLPGHGVSGGRDAGGSAGEGRAADGAGAEDRHRDRGRPRRRAQERHRPPRPEARQHHADEVGREAPRLRPGEARDSGQAGRLAGHEHADGAAAEPAADVPRHDPRDLPVHGARAARGRRGRRAQRHLRVRLRPLRDADGPEGVHRQEPGEPDLLDHGLGPAADLIDPADDPGLPRSDRQGMHREGARTALVDRARRDAAAAVDRGGRLDGGSAGARRRAAQEPREALVGRRGRRPCSPPRDSPTATSAARRSRPRSCDSTSRRRRRSRRSTFPGSLPTESILAFDATDTEGKSPDLGAAAERARGAAPSRHRGRASAVLVAGQPVHRIRGRRRPEEGRRHRRASHQDLRRARSIGRELEPGRRHPLRRHGRRSHLPRSGGGGDEGRSPSSSTRRGRRRRSAGRSFFPTASTSSTWSPARSPKTAPTGSARSTPTRRRCSPRRRRS